MYYEAFDVALQRGVVLARAQSSWDDSGLLGLSLTFSSDFSVNISVSVGITSSC